MSKVGWGRWVESIVPRCRPLKADSAREKNSTVTVVVLRGCQRSRQLKQLQFPVGNPQNNDWASYLEPHKAGQDLGLGSEKRENGSPLPISLCVRDWRCKGEEGHQTTFKCQFFLPLFCQQQPPSGACLEPSLQAQPHPERMLPA